MKNKELNPEALKDLYKALKDAEANIYWGNTLAARARHGRVLEAIAKAENK